MKKLVSLGLLALSIGCFTHPASAGQVDECEALKADSAAPKGLYGLCIAYYNAANGQGQARVAELFARKAAEADYCGVIPGTGVCGEDPDGDRDPDPDPEPTYACPCWTLDFLKDKIAAAESISCGTYDADGSPYDVLTMPDLNYTQFEAGEYFAGVDYCAYIEGYDIWNVILVDTSDAATQADIDVCKEDLAAAIAALEEQGISCPVFP